MKEFEDTIYSTMSIDQDTESDLLIFACINYDENYSFGINFPKKDTYLYLSMTHPEILAKYGNYKITKEDLDLLMKRLTGDRGWNKLMDAMKNCKESDMITDDFIKVDFSKLPETPPDYTQL